MKNRRPRFRYAKIQSNLLGSHDRDWGTYVEFFSPSIPLPEEMISFSDRFLVEFTPPSPNLFLEPKGSKILTVKVSMGCCSLLSFATDSPIVPVFGNTNLNPTDLRKFRKTLKGSVFEEFQNYGESLCQLAECVEPYIKIGYPKYVVQRILLCEKPPADKWYFFPWPSSDKILRGLTAYWLGMISYPASSRILNFWRAMEAVTNQNERYLIFQNLGRKRPAPVWSRVRRIPLSKNKRWRIVNSTESLRNVALKRRDELVKKYGTSRKGVDYLYRECRGKAAHADYISLEFDMAFYLSNQIKDSQLLQYMARVAIEEHW